MDLIIVESPTKARTFNKILKGKSYYVFATMGHIRDLPSNKISINYDKKFQPDYKNIIKKAKIISDLKILYKKYKHIILATDPDREGESIAYHVAYILGMIKENWPGFKIVDKDIKRIVFHEITEQALKESLEKPESLRVDLIKAQQARRILDRIVGYELSPLLWKKIGKYWLSAGRVQTVALRLIVEREKEINKFKSELYYQIFALFDIGEELKAKLIKKDNLSIEQSFKLNLFDGTYQYSNTTIDKSNIESILNELNNDTYKVSDIKESVGKRYPPPPHTTSLLQQDAFNRFGFSSKMTMKLAQDLYEGGLITYHRTDSFNMSTQFLFKAKDYIVKNFGEQYALLEPRFFKTKSKSAQEAHEAIRPTNLNNDINKSLTEHNLTYNHKKLYQLIFNRALSTQMTEAKIKQVKVMLTNNKNYLFESEFQEVIFDGFLKVLNPTLTEKFKTIPNLKKDMILKLIKIDPVESMTKSPPRYNEASLIKSLEEKGIGRPSTYSSIISLIQEKNYVEKDNRNIIPTQLGSIISDYLSKAFPEIFNINFTAAMEENLDNIASGNQDMIKLLNDFYTPFKKTLDIKKTDTKKIDVQEMVKEKCPNCDSQLMIRFSKYGKFLACSSFPKCRFTKPYLQTVSNKQCPKCGGNIVVRFTKRRKRFYGCGNYPKCDFSSWKL